MKFGGTSVGSAERMAGVISLVNEAAAKGTPVCVVLSAMAGVTNALIKGAKSALARNEAAARQELDALTKQHAESIKTLIKNKNTAAELCAFLQNKTDELAVLYKGIAYLGELSERSLDAISGMGELLSSRIAAAYASETGMPAHWLDARTCMVTNDSFGQATPLWESVHEACQQKLVPLLKPGTVVFTQGFIGATAEGISTTLGRGGSDYSASIFGVALNAKEIQIWTDVDGMMSADPRLVPNAKVLPTVSFQEASELAYFGAKVLHPLTIKPAVEKNIPVRILNTLDPKKPGTLIAATAESNQTVRAIATKKGIAGIFLNSPQMLMTHGFLAKVFAVFNQLKIPVDLISTSEISIALTIDTNKNLAELKRQLAELAEVDIKENLAIVSVIGRNFRRQGGIAGRVFTALGQTNVLMISGGASEINLSFVVASSEADDCLLKLHQEFFP